LKPKSIQSDKRISPLQGNFSPSTTPALNKRKKALPIPLSDVSTKKRKGSIVKNIPTVINVEKKSR
jgi:hypothetical protein